MSSWKAAMIAQGRKQGAWQKLGSGLKGLPDKTP